MQGKVEGPLVETGLLPGGFINSCALNMYHDGSEGIQSHYDDADRFRRPIYSLRLFSDSRLSFGTQLYGYTNGAFCVDMPRCQGPPSSPHFAPPPLEPPMSTCQCTPPSPAPHPPSSLKPSKLTCQGSPVCVSRSLSNTLLPFNSHSLSTPSSSCCCWPCLAGLHAPMESSASACQCLLGQHPPSPQVRFPTPFGLQWRARMPYLHKQATSTACNEKMLLAAFSLRAVAGPVCAEPMKFSVLPCQALIITYHAPPSPRPPPGPLLWVLLYFPLLLLLVSPG